MSIIPAEDTAENTMIVMIPRQTINLHKNVKTTGLTKRGKIHEDIVFIFTTTVDGQKKLLAKSIDFQPLLPRTTQIPLRKVRDPTAKHCQEIAIKEDLDGGKSFIAYRKPAERYKNNCRMMLSEIEAGRML